MLKAVLSLTALLASGPALADIEIGAHTGLNMINMDGQENAAVGAAMGARFGTEGRHSRGQHPCSTRRPPPAWSTPESSRSRRALGPVLSRQPVLRLHPDIYHARRDQRCVMIGEAEVEGDIPARGLADEDFTKILDLIYTEYSAPTPDIGDANMSTIYIGSAPA